MAGVGHMCLSVVVMPWLAQAVATDPGEEKMEDPRGWDLDQEEDSQSLGHA